MNRRWSDNDKNLGPITFSANKDNWKPVAAVFETGDDESTYNRIRLSLYWWTILLYLPNLISPWKTWVDLTGAEWAKSDGYYDIHQREYGFSLNDGFLQVFLGPQTHDSTTTKSWCKHLPWTQWRHVRHSLYGLNGEHWYTEGKDWNEMREKQDQCPSVSFLFEDYDGQELTAKTHIEEREWLFGEGWFKWLSLFRKPMIRRTLSINFSDEVGKEKGSWKGGTIGTSIDMLNGELHESAFNRYCDKEHRSKSGKYKIKYLQQMKGMI